MRFQKTVLAWAFNIEKINESSLEIIGALCLGTQRIIIPGHQSSKLKTVSSSLLAVPGMTWHRPLVREQYESWPRTQKRLLPPLLQCQGRRGTLPLQRGRVTSWVQMWNSVGREIVFHQPQISRGNLPTQIWRSHKNRNPVWKMYIFRSPLSFLHAWPPTPNDLKQHALSLYPFHRWQCCS